MTDILKELIGQEYEFSAAVAEEIDRLDALISNISSGFNTVNEETLTGTKTLTNASEEYQILNPNSASREVVLPSGAPEGLRFVIVNDSDGLVANNNILLIKETAGGATLVEMSETTGLYNLRVVRSETKWVFIN